MIFANPKRTAGIFGNAGIYGQAGLYSPGGFNPLSLDPYLLFDARDSMLGELESPTLDLDPAVPSSLDVITATRSGVATYTDADGVIQSASPNTVRVDHVDGVPMMLIEPSATNLVTDTDFSTWANSASNDAVGSAAPYGNFTKIAPSGNSSDAGVYKFISLTSGTFTQSCYAKFAGKHLAISSAGRWTGYFDLQAGTATGTGASIEPVGNGVFRCSVTGTDSSSATHAIKFLAIDALGSSSVTEDGVSGVEIAMPQVEEGAVATSFIPTSGSTVQRAADNLVIDGSAFSDFYNAAEGTFYAESITRRADGVPFIVEVENGADNRIYLYHGTTTTRSNVETGGTVQADFGIGNRPAVGVLSRVSLSYKTNDIKGSVDGGSVIGDTSATIPTTINNLNLGARFGQSDTFKLNGHIKRLIYWPTHSDSL